MPVTTLHPEYEAHLPEWQMIDQALAGEAAIKADPKNLPMPDGIVAMADKPEGKALQQGYMQRAQYEDWVKDSLRAMMGLVSRLQPTWTLPDKLAHMETEATDDGFTLWQLFSRIVEQSVSHGRVPMVVNIDDKGLPYIATYKAKSAINWKVGNREGRKDLVLAVFAETRDKDGSDEYNHDTVDVYRVFSLRDGKCVTWVENSAGGVIQDEVVLGTSDSNKPSLDYLPIVYCGSVDSGPDVDEVPLLSMARAALKSFQLSADYFSSLHQTSHPQPWVSGLSGDTELRVTGPSAAWDLGPDGECGYLEFQGAGIKAVREAMKDQKGAALEAGAKVMDVGAQESGDARKARQDDQHATLHSIVITCAEALQQVLKYAAQWVGANPDEVTFVVSPDFNVPQIDANLLKALQEDVVAGRISADTYWGYLTKGKLPEHDYNKELQQVDNPGNIADE